ncbi:MAG: hypothetical protein Q9225_002868 [Loekoesia sp. 1 TL-2023]
MRGLAGEVLHDYNIPAALYSNVKSLRKLNEPLSRRTFKGHAPDAIYECKATAQERPYASRPSRTQQLANPTLVPKLSSDVPNELLRKSVGHLVNRIHAEADKNQERHRRRAAGKDRRESQTQSRGCNAPVCFQEAISIRLIVLVKFDINHLYEHVPFTIPRPREKRRQAKTTYGSRLKSEKEAFTIVVNVVYFGFIVQRQTKK